MARTSGGRGGGGGTVVGLAQFFPNIVFGADPSGVLCELVLASSFIDDLTTIGAASSAGSMPSFTYAPGATIITVEANGSGVMSIPSTTDDLDFSIVVLVCNDAATEMIVLTGQVQIAEGAVGPVLIGPGDMSVYASTGSDLVYDSTSGAVTTTAGGIYGVSASSSMLWD